MRIFCECARGSSACGFDFQWRETARPDRRGGDNELLKFSLRRQTLLARDNFDEWRIRRAAHSLFLLEELNGAFVLLCFGARAEGPQILSFARLRIFLAGIEAVLSRL